MIRKLIRKALRRIRPYFHEGYFWGVALRNRSEKLLFEGGNGSFVLIPNGIVYWYADPFLFEYEGKHYLFVEMFNRLIGRGSIGVAVIKDGKCGGFKTCLKLSYHLSYPCVFERDGVIYMTPEMGASGKAMLYKAVDFPYKWEAMMQICDVTCVDTTPLPEKISHGKQFVSTFHHVSQGEIKKSDNLYLLDCNGEAPVRLKENDTCSRSAGHFIVKDGKIIRPVQDCTDSYGKGLLFNVVSYDGLSWQEENLMHITFPDDTSSTCAVPVCIKDVSSRMYMGIHTYNFDSEYEVIDLRYYIGYTWQYFIRKIIKCINGILR